MSVNWANPYPKVCANCGAKIYGVIIPVKCPRCGKPWKEKNPKTVSAKVKPVTPEVTAKALTEWTDEELATRRTELTKEQKELAKTATGTVQPTAEDTAIYQEQLRRHKLGVTEYNRQAMEATGLTKGDRVSYFAPAAFGLGGETYTGTVVFEKSGRLAVRLDRVEGGGRKIVALHKGFKKLGVAPEVAIPKAPVTPEVTSAKIKYFRQQETKWRETAYKIAEEQRGEAAYASAIKKADEFGTKASELELAIPKAKVDKNPIRHTKERWFWGSIGPFKTRAKAAEVAGAAYASGYKGRNPTTQTIGNIFGGLGILTIPLFIGIIIWLNNKYGK